MKIYNIKDIVRVTPTNGDSFVGVISNITIEPKSIKYYINGDKTVYYNNKQIKKII